ncbi:MAG: selenoneine biosynthesis selenosugar synthase SenB [Pseudomonadota bacterium]|nr:selenoneine biosynthesis selenosugar synthase SenB [Pseudomonadota bacterium]
MNIIQITPAGQKSISGNRTTANRCERIFRKLGHQVITATSYASQPADMMVAIHAYRSAESIKSFRQKYPSRPLMVCLGGTDINEFIYSHRELTSRSMEMADLLICLNDLVPKRVPKSLRHKARVIYQSARPLIKPRSPSKRYFDICVVANLRKVKDPMRAAIAVRSLPKESQIRVIHFGSASDPSLKRFAALEMKSNSRYIWKGQVPAWRVRREFLKTQLMVISSFSEGGANVVSEALVSSVPIVASKIDGNIGLLGKDYEGYFPVGDEKALMGLLLNIENDPGFLSALTLQCQARADIFSCDREVEAWKEVFLNLN